MLSARPTIGSTSRRLVRGYAAGGQNPHLILPSDSRTDVIRSTLYPADAPGSSSPTGVHHPQHAERVAHVIQSAESHETIERAWLLYQREKRARSRAILEAKYNSMVTACSELDNATRSQRSIYDRAMAKPSPVQIKGKGPEARWLEARIEGLVPREAWVPTETRGKGWNYEWRRPAVKN